MRPKNLKTKIFLDSGDPEETRRALDRLGFLDGQTTNPTLIAKNPEAAKRIERGEKFTEDEIYGLYKDVVQELGHLLPEGSISVEVYSDKDTDSRAMFQQSLSMYNWIPNAHIKFPTTTAGLQAAEMATREGMRVNMTLCFSQEQAAAVYAATLGAHAGSVFISPFIGRLDDIGQNGMDLIENIIKMYKESDHHVQVLAASTKRTINHHLYSIKLGADIITSPLSILDEWADLDLTVPGEDFKYERKDLESIPFRDIDVTKPWNTFNIQHDLTDKGLKQFSEDWNALITGETYA